MKASERERKFYEFLDCKLELLMHFVIKPSNGLNPILFKEEFTFDEWLKGSIGRREYSTGYKEAKPNIFGDIQIQNSKTLMYGFEYSIYRFVNYNFKVYYYLDDN